MVGRAHVRFALIALCLMAHPREAEAPPVLESGWELRNLADWEMASPSAPSGAGGLAESYTLPLGSRLVAANVPFGLS